VARDRQRAKQRKQRRGAGDPSQGSRANEPQRENVPNEWEHGGEVDEFDAALVAGAGGRTADDDAAQSAEPDDAGRNGDTDAVVPSGPARAGHPAPRERNRFAGFLRASWAELQRVQWPDRRQVGQATAVVLGFVVIAGAYLGLADVVAQRVVDFIL
jgi:preprotein translocase subunit SecE